MLMARFQLLGRVLKKVDLRSSEIDGDVTLHVERFEAVEDDVYFYDNKRWITMCVKLYELMRWLILELQCFIS